MNITSENRWFDANRFRGGRGYCSGSGSVIRSEGPRRQMPDFESWVRGELRWRNRMLYQTEGATDFRERVSRSIWPSKLGLSSYRILPARGILSFGGKVRLLLYACIRVMKFNNKPMRHQNRPNRQKSTFLHFDLL